MANISISPFLGACIPPFLDASLFPSEGGCTYRPRGRDVALTDHHTDLDGRFCAPIAQLPNSPTCCLPCPATQWAYADSFETYTIVAESLNVLGLALMVFMLISYYVLPAQQTRSHYLSVCLIISIIMIALAFTIPLVSRPDQCYNAITPHDMYSSMQCAWTGSFVIAGGLAAVVWIFIRALSMHLQICWDIVPGKKFFYAAQLVGWGIPAGLFVTTITLTGVSFRFGSACAVNYTDSLADFWTPMLTFSGLAGILQLSTFGYCIHVYLRNLWSDKAHASTSASSGVLPSYKSSTHNKTARAVYRRIKKVIWLQWRGICIVCIILVDVIFFSIVYLYLDNMQHSVLQNWAKAEPWLLCLVQNPDDKNACLDYVGDWLVNESTTVATLFLMALAGLQVFLLLTRPSIFPAWGRFIKSKLSSRQEFVSVDAKSRILRSSSKAELLKRQPTQEQTAYEMENKTDVLAIDIGSRALSPTISSPSETYLSPLHEYRDSPMSDADSEGVMPAFNNGRGRMPAEYVGRITPSPNTPTSSSFGAHIHRQRPPTDYFDANLRGEPGQSERRYPPNSFSFSAPRPPSRHSSFRSIGINPPASSSGRQGRAFSASGSVTESVEILLPPNNLRH